MQQLLQIRLQQFSTVLKSSILAGQITSVMERLTTCLTFRFLIFTLITLPPHIHDHYQEMVKSPINSTKLFCVLSACHDANTAFNSKLVQMVKFSVSDFCTIEACLADLGCWFVNIANSLQSTRKYSSWLLSYWNSNANKQKSLCSGVFGCSWQICSGRSTSSSRELRQQRTAG